MRGELFGRLMAAKTNPDWWASLSAAQCLKYDYKQGSVALGPGLGPDGGSNREESAYGVASMLVSAADITGKADFAASARSFMESRGLFALLCTCAVRTPADGMRKQLVLCARSPDDLAAVRAAMAATMDAPLGLAPLDTTSALIPPVDSGDLVACAAFDQREVAMSRKQSMPLIAAALASGPPS